MLFLVFPTLYNFSTFSRLATIATIAAIVIRAQISLTTNSNRNGSYRKWYNCFGANVMTLGVNGANVVLVLSFILSPLGLGRADGRGWEGRGVASDCLKVMCTPTGVQQFSTNGI